MARIVESFYGGENSYSTFDHIMCAAGLTVVSPAVRGSSGFGKAFSALNDRDLGGDETLLVQSGRAQGIFKTHEDAPASSSPTTNPQSAPRCVAASKTWAAT